MLKNGAQSVGFLQYTCGTSCAIPLSKSLKDIKPHPFQETMPHHIDNPPFSRKDAIWSGWLISRIPSLIPFRPWKQYWFVLADGRIHYFKHAGSVPLHGCRMISRTSNDPEEPLGFVLEINPRVFGQSLEDTIVNESEECTREIPVVVERCVSYLRENGLYEEGIFRLNGRSSMVQQLQDIFDNGEVPDFDSYGASSHTVASLLKRYFQYLPEPIIPWRHCRYFIPAMQRLQQCEDEGRRQLVIQLALLPKVNYNLLKFLCRFLHEVHKFEAHNKMGLGNLANIFAPHILRPQHAEGSFLLGSTALSLQLVHYLIRNQDKVFPPISTIQMHCALTAKDFIAHEKLAKECAKRASLQESKYLNHTPMGTPEEEPRMAKRALRPREVTQEEEECGEMFNYVNGEVTDGDIENGINDCSVHSIYENLEIPTNSTQHSVSLIESLKSRISEVPSKPRTQTEHKAKRYGVSYRDPSSIMSPAFNGPKSSSYSNGTSQASHPKDEAVGRGKKPKVLKGDVHSQLPHGTTYQNIELGVSSMPNGKESRHTNGEVLSKPLPEMPPKYGEHIHNSTPKMVGDYSNETFTTPYGVKMAPLINGEGPGHMQSMRNRLRQKDDELSKLQKSMERLKKEYESMKLKLNVEESARLNAEEENQQLHIELEYLRRCLASR
ncbi:uncharacterized protein [Diadema setosum]|uniref:uncharacterized protein isoform X2 n=1 Tax=Diadema setosum TaxID=31175 RepID=UPI003B3A324B